MASSSKLARKDLLSPPPPPHPPSLQLPASTKPLPNAINRAQAQAQAQNQAPPVSNSHAIVDFLSPSQHDLSLSMSSHLTRHELLRRRLNRMRRLSKVYRDHYWALMEDLRVQYREYYWKYGISPCKEDDDRESGGERELVGFNVEGCGETNNANYSNNNNVSVVVGGNGGGNCGGKLGLGIGESMLSEVKLGGNNRCTFVGCKLKAMALTSFCHLHILSDPQQKLYKACSFVIKSAQAGPILCGKPILRSTIPSLCNIHLQKAQKHVTRALKKAGLNVSSSSKLAPKLHVIMAEYVNQIQSKRRGAQKANGKNIAIKEEATS